MENDEGETWLELAALTRNVVAFLRSRAMHCLPKEVSGLSCIGVPLEPTGQSLAAAGAAGASPSNELQAGIVAAALPAPGEAAGTAARSPGKDGEPEFLLSETKCRAHNRTSVLHTKAGCSQYRQRG